MALKPIKPSKQQRNQRKQEKRKPLNESQARPERKPLLAHQRLGH